MSSPTSFPERGLHGAAAIAVTAVLSGEFGASNLIELALAGGAQAIVTHNLRNLRGGELRLGNLRVLTPAQCLEELK